MVKALCGVGLKMGDLGKVLTCFDRLDFRFSTKKKDLENRITAQKIVYLLGLKGVKGLNYKFNWYLRGPYSRELTFDLYQKSSKEKELTESEEKKILELKEIFDGFDAQILEAAAAYSYYAFEKKLDATYATRKTRETKANLSGTKVELGMSKAKEFLYSPTKEELAEMKSEFAPWQAAGLESWGRFD